MSKVYKVSGMHCASCAINIERTLKKDPAVFLAEASYGNESVKLDFDEKKVSLSELSKHIEPLGYSIVSAKEKGGADTGMHMAGHDHAKMLKEEELKSMRNEVRVLLPLAGLSIISMAFDLLVAGGVISAMPMIIERFFKFALPLIAFYSLVFPGRVYLRGVWHFVRHGMAGMDALVGIGTGVAFLYSLIVIIFYSFLANYINVENLYFDVTIVVIAFITLGKYLESRSKLKTGDAIKQLLELQAKTAIVLINGVEREVSVSEVKHNDLIVIKPGGKIPVDGVITEGNSNIDESMISGEPMPVSKKVGDLVVSGTINKQGSFIFKAIKVGSETMLSQIVKMVEEAQGSRAPIQNLADKISAVFVPVVIAVAVVSLLLWIFVGLQFMSFADALSYGLTSFVGVLVIACPCALGLATPTAIIVAVGKGAKNGILIKDAGTLQQLHRVNTVVVDKTGTITEGKPKLTNFENVSDMDDNKIFAIMASIENKSEHPIAGAIVESLRERKIDLLPVTDFHNIEGKGVSAIYEGIKYYVGSPALMDSLGHKFDEEKIYKYVSQGATPVFFATDKQLFSYALVSDNLKEESKKAVSVLQKLGIEVVMLTGDDKRTAEYIAKEVGIKSVVSEVLPNDKLQFIKDLQSGQYEKWHLKLPNAKRVVAMAGDGVNDAPALAKADVGIAMATGSDVAIESAGITLLHGDISKLSKAVVLSRATMRTIKQNLFWAFVYNVIGIPLAGGAFYPIFKITLSPIFAGMAMGLSSVSVVSNSLRLKMKKL